MRAPLVSDSKEGLRQASGLLRYYARAQQLMEKAQAGHVLQFERLPDPDRLKPRRLPAILRSLALLCFAAVGVALILRGAPQVQKRELIDSNSNYREIARAETEPVIGEYHAVTMPNDGQRLMVQFKGHVEQMKDLPHAPAIGDEYTVTECPGAYWVWCVPLGWTHPAWVDP